MQEPKCQLKRRKDDIPKVRAGEKSWHCEGCNALLFAERKPACPRTIIENVRAQAQNERHRLRIED